MHRLWSLVLFMALVLPAVGAADSQPLLRSAFQRNGHVVVIFSLGDLAAGQLVVATSPDENGAGALATNIKLREKLTVPQTTGLIRRRSSRALPHGVYFVQVSGVDTGGVTDCMPRQTGCGQEWSNVRKVTIPVLR